MLIYDYWSSFVVSLKSFSALTMMEQIKKDSEQNTWEALLYLHTVYPALNRIQSIAVGKESTKARMILSQPHSWNYPQPDSICMLILILNFNAFIGQYQFYSSSKLIWLHCMDSSCMWSLAFLKIKWQVIKCSEEKKKCSHEVKAK